MMKISFCAVVKLALSICLGATCNTVAVTATVKLPRNENPVRLNIGAIADDVKRVEEPRMESGATSQQDWQGTMISDWMEHDNNATAESLHHSNSNGVDEVHNASLSVAPNKNEKEFTNSTQAPTPTALLHYDESDDDGESDNGLDDLPNGTRLLWISLVWIVSFFLFLYAWSILFMVAEPDITDVYFRAGDGENHRHNNNCELMVALIGHNGNHFDV